MVAGSGLRRAGGAETYSDSGEDVLEFVDEGDQAWVVDVDSADVLATRGAKGLVVDMCARIWICCRHDRRSEEVSR